VAHKKRLLLAQKTATGWIDRQRWRAVVFPMHEAVVHGTLNIELDEAGPDIDRAAHSESNRKIEIAHERLITANLQRKVDLIG